MRFDVGTTAAAAGIGVLAGMRSLAAPATVSTQMASDRYTFCPELEVRKPSWSAWARSRWNDRTLKVVVTPASRRRCSTRSSP